MRTERDRIRPSDELAGSVDQRTIIRKHNQYSCVISAASCDGGAHQCIAATLIFAPPSLHCSSESIRLLPTSMLISICSHYLDLDYDVRKSHTQAITE